MKVINYMLESLAIVLMIPFFVSGLIIGLVQYGLVSGINSFKLWFER